jgi:hypothetical protein
MAHGDYHCCAVCDCKMQYDDYDARTKEDICTACLRALHGVGAMVYTGQELAAWITANPEAAQVNLPGIGFSKCFYPNPVDAAFAALSANEVSRG